MSYLNKDFWEATMDFEEGLPEQLSYKYLLKNEDGGIVNEWGNDRFIQIPSEKPAKIQFVDTWNHAGEFENTFYTAPFAEVLIKKSKAVTGNITGNPSHIFKIKAPLLKKNEAVCILGNAVGLNQWSEANPVVMAKTGDWWTVGVNLLQSDFPLNYKYGVYNIKENAFVRFENGDNRLLTVDNAETALTFLHDGFVNLPNDTWKGSGVAIPVFSLRSKKGFGVGEFTDIKLLVDWAKETGLKLIQLLPVNDTTSTNTWLDSYPYGAITAFALHPLYINLTKVAGKENLKQFVSITEKRDELNQLAALDYEQVMKYKVSVLRELYAFMGKECLAADDYKMFFDANSHWLKPYAAFCYFRDKYGTSDFSQWETNAVYSAEEIEKLFAPRSASAKELGFYFFTQYHLHLQLKDAVDYAHKKGIVIKGDIPIGISRNSCDAWVSPELYHMEWQAGAPPDDFAAVGQNWGFPIYNWAKMKEDGFAWWKQRFEQMSNYFDAFRIDHILGFFRIWSIPAHAVQGIMGHFIPCLSVHANEFGENGIWFDYQRFCKPFITDEVVNEIFGELGYKVKEQFIRSNNAGGYELLPEFETQRAIEQYFDKQEHSDENERLKLGLYDLVSNVILFEEDGSMRQHFHFRIAMEKTTSFRYLIPHIQEKLRNLYVNYFYRRQDDFWFKEAMQKLPKLKDVTNMLVCGEDLGMVPGCVPEVMKQLGILSLEIQRMPKDPEKEFFYPNDAPYMSVITPSTHDMSTVRGWWEENREKTQHFYNHILGQWGTAPQFCEPWINRAIVMQHLYSPAMWSIFQLQDLLGMSDKLRRENPNDERINIPANPKHYWQYRMHITLEDLLKQDDFNEELKGYVENSGR